MPTGFLAEKCSSQFGAQGSRRLVLGVALVALAVSQAGMATMLGRSTQQLSSDNGTNPTLVAAMAAANRNPITVTAHLGKATQGTTFRGQISARGGITPYHFSVRSGVLPTGLSLNKTTGTLAGTPLRAGTSDFMVRVSGHYWQHFTDLGLRLTVDPKSGVTITVTPVSVTVASGARQQLTAAVHGSENTQVMWSASAGTITSSGLFTAPTVSGAINASLRAIVTATSVADAKAAASSTILVTPAVGGVTVTVSPASATVTSGSTQQLAATVHGSTNSQVRWSASAGTISTSGLFTAPTVSSAATATITATSAAVPSASASSTISVTPVTSANLAVSTTGLPDASQGSAYSASLSATGGSQPYAWSVTAGSLPAGMSLNAAGILSGTPSKTGSFSFTAKVADAASHNASSALAVTVNIPNTNAKFDGPAELPRVYIQSALANTPANGKTWQVADGPSLQSALNAAACGDTISLKAGATFTGAWAFPGKSCDDQHWIVVRTSAPDSSLPPEGTRVTPCFAGVASLPGRPALNCSSVQNVMAKLVMGISSGSGPIAFTAGANHYRFIGLEVTRLANASAIGNLAYPTAGSTGDHIIFDRVWMHGTVRDDTTRGIYLSGLTHVALVDSYLNDFHCESKTGTCTDAQAISGGLGTAAGGPYKIVNNFLESAAENILFGGGHATQTPADIEIRHNHFFKPLTWMPGHSGLVLGNHGNPFIVKNHFELKNAQRVLFDGNLAENSWGGFSQPGFTIVLTPKNQTTPNGGVCPICQVTDVTIRNSKFSHLGGGFQIANALDTGGTIPPFAGARYSIHDVVLDDISDAVYVGQGQLAQVSTGLSAPLLSDLQMTHITAFPSHMLFDVGNGTSPKMPNFVFSNSIVTTGTNPIWTVGGPAATCAISHLVPSTVLNACFGNYTFSSNTLIGVPSRFPAASWPSGNTMAADGNSVGFVNFNSGNGGDYHLKSGSAFKGAASDGKDMGADIDAITAATAGVY